jgi:predicted nucleotidyltransferase
MFDELLARIARALDARGIPYMVIGGQAVLLYGEPRLTRDIDVTLGVDVDALPAVLEATRDARLAPLVDPASFVARSMVLPVKDDETGIRVDLVFSFTPYEQEAIARSRAHPVGGADVRFASPEDLIVHKMLAARPRDIEDVRSILVRQPGLDRDLVRRTLRDFDAALDRDLAAQFEALVAGI